LVDSESRDRPVAVPLPKYYSITHKCGHTITSILLLEFEAAISILEQSKPLRFRVDITMPISSVQISYVYNRLRYQQRTNCNLNSVSFLFIPFSQELYFARPLCMTSRVNSLRSSSGQVIINVCLELTWGYDIL
jgi:hypothetical protein